MPPKQHYMCTKCGRKGFGLLKPERDYLCLHCKVKYKPYLTAAGKPRRTKSRLYFSQSDVDAVQKLVRTAIK